MRVETLGDGEPEVAIVGGIHGDEPCGPKAVEALLDADLDVERPVKLIVANEKALEKGVRYVEEDLNRAFPGAPDADTHEGRLAHELLTEIRGCEILSLHSTQSYAAPFALVDEMDGHGRSICPYLSVEAVVETAGYSTGRLIAYPDVIELECGIQRSAAAAENAERLAREFLVATSVLAGTEQPRRDHRLPVFRMERQIPKPDAEEYEVFVDNFERVGEGEAFAAADGEVLHAEFPFYPILLSAYGYENEFGYAGDLVARLDGDEPPVPTTESASARAEGPNR
ncbi:succinylglutamate desuccinylase/aspartoacylase family protein [Natronomonas halophila]|uniref:succinylglutamate desuccinylase/aspartoacylase domain-containing protein n=1 Tax=Natronomonas halophila TaxID=2747817 RepID=UPI0015B60A85|nr:succinylglutamate desuccinylase/aspartoacylase family protein [Natronomonas halophila]QLD84544.1 succinylglutamate desuccinylase/aspartoacylase family protein [Natronomonas halophila]